MVRAVSLVAILVAMAWSAGQVLAASSTAVPGECFPDGSRTLAQSNEARVYKGSNGARYGCLFKTGHRVRLASAARPLRAIRTAGPFAAFSEAPYHDGALDEDVPWTVFSIGLCRDDGRRFKYTVATTRVFDLVVSRYGDVAWIVAGPHGYDVNAIDASTSDPHQPTVLGSGDDIDPRSLTISGTTVKWRESGDFHSARMKPRVSSCRP
jgi:hypothetical protein